MFGSLRASTQLRLALAERDFAEQDGAVPPGICALLSKDPSQVRRQFREAFAEDTRAAIGRLIRLMQHEAFPELLPTQFDINFDAEQPSVVAAVSGEPTSKPRVTLSAGLVLALEDALLAALCEGAFFANAGFEAEDLDEPIPFLRNSSVRSDRFRFYDLSTEAPLASREIQSLIPRAAWRLYQFDVLSELAIHFICLHEIAHWALGHLGLAAARAGRMGTATLSEVGQHFAFQGGKAPDQLFEALETKCLEMQADFRAIELHYFYHRARGNRDSVLAQYAATMRRLIAVRGTVLGVLDEAQEHRVLACAAGAMFLLLEAWSRARHTADSITHPLPETRALQLLTVTFALANWKHRTEREDGSNVVRTTDDDVIAEVEKTIRGQFQSLIIDMQGMSDILGIPALFLRTDLTPTASEDPDLSSQSATFQDLLHLLFEGAKSREQFSTKGGQEFFELRTLDPLLRAEAAAHVAGRPQV